MIRTYVKLTLFAFILMLPALCQAQSGTASPYSRYGIGDLQNQTGAQGFAMGQTGNALRNDTTTPFFINSKNPASYLYNRITTFEAGILDNNLSLTTMGQSHINSSASFAYFALAFPVTKWSGASLGITPLSSEGYSINSTTPIDSIAPNGTQVPVDNANVTYAGSGNITDIYLGYAVSPFYKIPVLGGLSIGAHLCYLFGNLTSSEVLQYPDNYPAFTTESIENTQVSSFYLNYGAMWTFGKPSGFNVTAGFTAALASNLNAIYSVLTVNDYAGLVYDTIENSNTAGKMRMPLMLGYGLTIRDGQKWTFTFDYNTQNWSQYTFLGQSQNLDNSKIMGFGAEYVPHKNFDAPHTYFKRVHYRIGASFTQTYLDVNNTPLNDYNVSLGVGFPIGPNRPLMRGSVLNIGLQAGQLGTTSNNLLQERYLKVLFSFTFDDRWFIKRQFE